MRGSRPPHTLFFLTGVLALSVVMLAPAPANAESGFGLSASSSLSPGGNVYPGTALSLSGSVSNSGVGDYSGTITGTYQYSLNGGSWSDWQSSSVTDLKSGSTKSFSSINWNAGTDVGNTWSFRLCASASDGTHCSGVNSLTIVNPPPPPPPSVSANLSPTGDIFPGTSLSLSGSVSGSGYTGSNCWYLSVNGGSSFCWVAAGSGTGAAAPVNWSAGSADPSVTYTFSLCTSTSVCATAGSLRVVALPKTTPTITWATPSAVAYGTALSGTQLNATASVAGSFSYSPGSGTAVYSSQNLSVTFTPTDTTSYNTASASVFLTVNPQQVFYNLSISQNGSGSVSGAGSYASGAVVTASAIPSSGYSFSSWSGCDSVSGSSCTVTMNSSRTVTANFTQLFATANFTSPSGTATLNYKGGTYLNWVSSNTSSCTLTNFGSVPTSYTGVNYYTGNLTSDTTFTLTCTPVSGAAGTPTAGVTIKVSPPPSSNCTATFNNVISHTTSFSVQSWGVTASGGVSNCPESYFTNLKMSGDASLDSPGGPHPGRVFDFGVGGGSYVPFGTYCGYEDTMQQTGGKALQNSGTVSRACSGGGTSLPTTGSLGFWPTVISVSSGTGSWGSISYINTDPFRAGFDLFYAGILPWGNYNFHLYNTFTGTYKCPDGDVPINITVPLVLCEYEPNDGGAETQYYDSQCTALNPNRASVPLACPSAPVTIVLDVPSPPPTIGTVLDFTHKLSVQSKLDGASKPGVNITEISVTSSDPNFAFPANYFAGVTDYERLAERNVTVVLEAPQNHPQGGSLDTINPWTGDCTPVAGNPRQCSVSFEFSVLGGQKKTVIANYSSALAAPTLSTNTPSCDAGAGKVQVWWSTVSGAASYRLYRSDAAFTATRSIWATIVYAATVTELDSDPKTAGIQPFPVAPTQTNPFLDSGLSAGTQYYYQVKAFSASGVSSPVSATKQDDASKRCPDLIVESITLPSSPGYPAGTVLGSTPDQPRSYTFGAVIKNQGEGTDATKTFLNQISVNGMEVENIPKNQPISNGLAAGATKTITSGSWTADSVTTTITKTIKVCADQPPFPEGAIRESPPTGIPPTGNPAEENNCSTTNSAIVTIIPELTVQLEVAKSGSTVFSKNYIIIDYKDLGNLRWVVGGTPTSCAGVAGTDLTGPVVKESYKVTNNPFSLTNLLNKISFKYQIECTR